MSDLTNKFITQSEVDEKRKRRQEEWEQKRKADDPMECPEEDNRSLYEKLQEQKQKKDEEYEEQHKLKNSVKGLDEDEAQFLEFVSNKQMEIDRNRSAEEKAIIKELKESAVSSVQPIGSQDKSKPKPSPTAQPNKKSQTALLAGAVKRKGTTENEDSKKRKSEDDATASSSTNRDRPVTVQSTANQRLKVIGVLPGLGAYDNDTSDSETSSSDTDGDFKEFKIVHRKFKVQIEQQ